MWKKNGKGSQYVGTYEREAGGDRVFVLIGQKGGKKHRVTFESHEAAKKSGWKKVGGV